MEEYADHGAEDESNGDSKSKGSPVNKVEQVKRLRNCTQFLLKSGAPLPCQLSLWQKYNMPCLVNIA